MDVSAAAPSTSEEMLAHVPGDGVGDELSDVDDQNPNDSSGSGGGSGAEPEPSPAVEHTEEAAQTSGIGGSELTSRQSANGGGVGVGTGLANRLVIVRHNRSVRAPDLSLFRPMINLERRLKRSSLYDIGPPTPEPPPRVPADEDARRAASDTAETASGQTFKRQSSVRETIHEESDAMPAPAPVRESETSGNGSRRASKRVTILEVGPDAPPTNGTNAHNRDRSAGPVAASRFYLRAACGLLGAGQTQYPSYQPGTGDMIRRVQLKLHYGTRSISLRPDSRAGAQYLPRREVERAAWDRAANVPSRRNSRAPSAHGSLLLANAASRPSETLQYLVDVRKDLLIHAGQSL